jgi:hypothetical protein
MPEEHCPFSVILLCLVSWLRGDDQDERAASIRMSAWTLARSGISSGQWSWASGSHERNRAID